MRPQNSFLRPQEIRRGGHLTLLTLPVHSEVKRQLTSTTKTISVYSLMPFGRGSYSPATPCEEKS